MTRRLLAVLAVAAVVFAWRLDRPGFSDTEGMFAEPAREMVETGDWVTPRMNGEPFLTKPPLAYWLAASVMATSGPTEYARVVPALAALGTVAVTAALGTELLGEAAGLTAAVVLATSAGFLLEARLLRADMLLVLAITTALWAAVRVGRRRSAGPAIVFWVAIALGVLAKGFLALAIPAGAIALGAGDLRPRTLLAQLRALRASFGLALLAAIVVPWHLLAGGRNPGFLWDYVVNQHLLVFFDAKLPRDSIPDSLGFFWGMLLVRALPWSVLLPAAVVHAWRAPERRAALRLPAAWIAVVVGLFSLASGRLEHYSLPALPPLALVIGCLVADAAAGRARAGRAWLAAPPAVAAALAVSFALRDPAGVIAAIDPTFAGHGVDRLVRPAAVSAAVGLATLALLLVRRRGWPALIAGAACAVAVFGVAEIAHERLEPLFSWRPLARTIRATVPGEARVFFRASDEYQLCGGLDYYTGGPVALLSPPGWTPPTFLVGRTERLFTPRSELEHSWREGTAVLVADDVMGPGDAARLAPGPFVVLAQAGRRVVLRPSRGAAAHHAARRSDPGAVASSSSPR